MKRHLRMLALAVAVALPLSAYAVSVQITNNVPDANSPGCTAGTCISAEGCDSTIYTGWIHIEGYSAATLGVTFTDANDSVTAINTTCWTDLVSSTANGSGYEVCSGSTSSGTTTMTCPHTWTITSGTAEQYTIMVDNLNSRWLNCSFACTGTPAAADVITVKVLTKTP